MQVRRVKNLAEDYIVYPLFYFGMFVAAVCANTIIFVWDAVVHFLSILKKK